MKRNNSVKIKFGSVAFSRRNTDPFSHNFTNGDQTKSKIFSTTPQEESYISNTNLCSQNLRNKGFEHTSHSLTRALINITKRMANADCMGSEFDREVQNDVR